MDRNTRRTLDLLQILTDKEITVKYKRTALGFLWSLMNPILSALVLFIAFKIFMRFQMKDYTLFMLSAMFPWTWFSASVLMCVNTLTGNTSLIKKVIFPKRLLILSVINGQLVTLIFSIPILAAMTFYYGMHPVWTWLYGIPLLMAIQYFIIYGMGMLTSMVNAYFRDMEHIIAVCINMLFWMTPIMYPLQMVPEKYRIFLVLNPMTYLIESWRDVIMGNNINWDYILISVVTAGLVMSAGTAVFNRMDKRIDEVL